LKITIQAFSVREIPRRVLASIPEAVKRGKTLVAYVIGQEGESRPTSLNDRKTLPLSWPAKAIEKLADLARGTKLFKNHQEGTNDNTGRSSVGEVVASYIDEIGGKLSAIVVAPFDKRPDEDVCSIEANIDFREEGRGFIVDAVSAITGIALGKSEEETPAFSGARQIAAVQCFTPHQFTSQGSNRMEITFKDVEEFVRERKVWPSQLFDIKTVLQDNEFRETFKAKYVSPEDLKRVQDDYEAVKSQLSTYQKKEGRSKGKEALESKLKENTTDAQREWILREWDKSSNSDFSDTGLDKFIQEQSKEYEYIVKKFGAPNKSNEGGKSPEEERREKEEEEIEIEDLAASMLGAK